MTRAAARRLVDAAIFAAAVAASPASSRAATSTGAVAATAPAPAASAAPAPAARRAPARFAIVIGNNQPESDAAPTLRYADDDAASTYRLLTQAGVRGVLLSRFDDDTRRFWSDVAPQGAPRGAAFDDAVARLFVEMRAAASRGLDTELFLFYSGHGDVAQGEGYVLLEDRRLTRGDLYRLLARSPATRNHVFIDACKSYFLAFGRGPGGERVSYGEAFVPPSEPGRLGNVGFVLSTSSDRDSHEWERFQGGILSHELRSALRGAADVDGDGRVTYAELGAFIATANRAIENPRFRPDVLVWPPGRDLGAEVLRWSDGDSSRTATATVVRVRGGDVGHLYLENARGERLLDAHPAPGQSLILHVPAERPLFVRKHDGSAEQVVAATAPVVVASLEPRAPELRSKGALQLAFDRFFSLPFAGSDVAEFTRGQRRLDLRARDPHGVGARPAPAAPGRALRIAAGVTGVTALAAGLAASAVAWQRWRDGGGGSQADIAADNAVIHRANVASVIGYTVALAAGATWAWLRWHGASATDVSH